MRLARECLYNLHFEFYFGLICTEDSANLETVIFAISYCYTKRSSYDRESERERERGAVRQVDI